MIVLLNASYVPGAALGSLCTLRTLPGFERLAYYLPSI